MSKIKFIIVLVGIISLAYIAVKSISIPTIQTEPIKPTYSPAAPANQPFSSITALSQARDDLRAVDERSINQALAMYFADKHYYPPTLGELTPGYLGAKLLDPKTKLPYQYTVLQGGEAYQFCINYESKGVSCTNSN